MIQERPIADIVAMTDNATATIYKAYRRCYSGECDIPEEADHDSMEAFIATMLAAEHPHESPLEHVSLTFHVVCSRAASHQFVRHRIASFSQQSQRYVKSNEVSYIMPKSVENSTIQRSLFKAAMWLSEFFYGAMIRLGAKAEDARSVLTNATATRMIVTMNCRELRHFFEERTCNRAQEEIRHIAKSMRSQAIILLPSVFSHSGPKCMTVKHCPEPSPCGEKPWKDKI